MPLRLAHRAGETTAGALEVLRFVTDPSSPKRSAGIGPVSDHVAPATPWPRQGFVPIPNEHRSVSGIDIHPTSGSESPGPRSSSHGRAIHISSGV